MNDYFLTHLHIVEEDAGEEILLHHQFINYREENKSWSIVNCNLQYELSSDGW